MVNLSQPRAVLRVLGAADRAVAVDAKAVAAAPSPQGPPPRSRRLAELGAVAQVGRLMLASPRLARAPRGDGSVVVDVPGWLAPEVSNLPVRAYLRRLGWDARGWGHGTNTGDPVDNAVLLSESVLALARERGPVSLIGWSLGGVIAREVARAHPAAVRSVVTFGSPILAGPKYTAAATRFGAAECDRVERLARELDSDSPITVPMTTIFTRRDGVVSWTACLDRASPHVRHLEVGSTHLGLGFDPDVWLAVARALAATRP